MAKVVVTKAYDYRHEVNRVIGRGVSLGNGGMCFGSGGGSLGGMGQALHVLERHVETAETDKFLRTEADIVAEDTTELTFAHASDRGHSGCRKRATRFVQCSYYARNNRFVTRIFGAQAREEKVVKDRCTFLDIVCLANA